MQFPKEFPDKLRSSILASEVVGKKVQLKQRGKEFQGLCPFHNEKSPSFTVNDQKGFYHCFGCQEHGDIVSFLMKVEGLSFPEAVVQLADDFGIQVPKVSFDQGKEDKLDRDYLILEKALSFFEENLNSKIGDEAFNYLQGRGFNRGIIKKFRLGYSLNSYESLLNYLKKEGFSSQEIVKTGIVGQNDKKNLYDKFRNRVIFPIFDKKNRVIAFGGRCLGDEMPKYLNSAETDLFKKNLTLYNYSFAKKEIFDKGYAVLVEGYADVISLYANGVKNVVAGLGTALSEGHFKELFYITNKIVICLDGDGAGTKAAKRASEIILPLVSAKKNVSFAFLPNKMDPDDFVKEFGAKKMEELFLDATTLSEGLFEFALDELKIDKNKKITAEDKAKIEENLSAKIEVIKDNSLKKYFSIYFKDLLFSLGKRQKKGDLVQNFNKKIFIKKPSNFSDIIAKNIIAFIIKNPYLASFRDDNFDVRQLYFASDELSQLKELVIEIIDENDKKILERLENKGFNSYIIQIREILTHLENDDPVLDLVRFRVLLFKDLLIQVDRQYKDSLSQIDEISTHQSGISDQKIKEIFDYKTSLEQQILLLEKELT